MRARPTNQAYFDMDNLFASYIDGLIFLFGAGAIAFALCAILAAISDYLQAKLDELNRQVDNQQDNNEQ